MTASNSSVEKNSDDEIQEPSKANLKSKRKTNGSNPQPMKKIRYGNITDDAKPAKKPKNELYKPPTVEELNELKETENLYNNNLFRLQIEELIKETQIKNKHKTHFAVWLESFKILIENLPQFDNISSSCVHMKKRKKGEKEQTKFLNKLSQIHTDIIASDQELTLKFQKPNGLELFGLNQIKSLPGPILQININLKMPKGYFHEKDYLNNRYFLKRYFYLLYIAYHIEISEIATKIIFKFHEDNNLLPIIQLVPNNSDKTLINIYATPAEDYFKLPRFLPDKNNVKTNVFNDDSSQIFDGELLKKTPTPFYNSAMAHDVTLSFNSTCIENLLAPLPSVQEGIKLLYIWLKQRELNEFSTNLILYIVCYLVKKKKINKYMSSYQVIRNFWNFLIQNDLSEEPISLCDSTTTDVLESFQRNFHLVVLDFTGYHNVSAYLTEGLYRKVQDECRLAFKLLDDGGLNSFQSLFITRLPFQLQYDLIVNLDDTNFKHVFGEVDDDVKIRRIGYYEWAITDFIAGTLKRGLGKRFRNIVPRMQRTNNWEYGQKFAKNNSRISYGINLDPITAFGIIDMGPSLDDPKEKEFRDFWGKFTSDRRFKDGSVCVCVHFETKTIQDRRRIIKRIINYLLKEKLKLNYNLHYDEFEKFVENRKLTTITMDGGTNEEACLKIISTSNELERKMRDLKMPLTITGVQPNSDFYNLTEWTPPIQSNFKFDRTVTTVKHHNAVFVKGNVQKLPNYVQPIESVLQLEHSSKWPDTLQGIQKMKTAFYLEISKLLAKKEHIASSVKPDRIDIVYQGFVFRYSLYLHKEIGLMKKESTDDGVVVYKNTPQSLEIEKKYHVLPMITSALKGIQMQHPSYGPSTALVKRWLRSHLIDDHLFPNVVINLLNVSLYLNCSPYAQSNTPQIAFLRFLKFISELQWNLQPVIVNFNDEITKENLGNIDTKLLHNREAFPELIIATPYDNCESIFTKRVPTKEILNRVKQLARSTLEIYQKHISGRQLMDLNKLFIPNLSGYNVLIHLNTTMNPRNFERITVETKSIREIYKPHQEKCMPVVGFNPVEFYLAELRRNYGEFACFFHDTYGGDVIGVLWTPKALGIKEFKVANVNGRKLQNDMLVLNVDGLINDFYVLGKGLVKTIEKSS